jgi:predicted GNAT family acetyltransferase
MEKKCVVCDATNQQVPLIKLDYQDQELYVCPQHMPVLIHHPEQLAGKIAGAEDFKAG